jgi:hypothetical protein
LSTAFPVSWAALKAKWVVAEEPASTSAAAAPVIVAPNVEQVQADIQMKMESVSLNGNGGIGHVVGC